MKRNDRNDSLIESKKPYGLGILVTFKRFSLIQNWYIIVLFLLVEGVVSCNKHVTVSEPTIDSVDVEEEECFVDNVYNNPPEWLKRFREADKNETSFWDFIKIPEVKSCIIETKSQAYYDKMSHWVGENGSSQWSTVTQLDDTYEYIENINKIQIVLKYNIVEDKMYISMKDQGVELDSKGDNPRVKEIMSQTINFREILRGFRNPIKAERDLLNRTMYIKAEIDEIARAGDEHYKYVLKSRYSIPENGYLRIYTNDEHFVSFDYPKTIIIKAYFRQRYIDQDFFTGYVNGIYYNFLDGQAVIWEN